MLLKMANEKTFSPPCNLEKGLIPYSSFELNERSTLYVQQNKRTIRD